MFIKSLQNYSDVFWPNFLQNAAEIPNYMGMGHGPKIVGKILVILKLKTFRSGRVMVLQQGNFPRQHLTTF